MELANSLSNPCARTRGSLRLAQAEPEMFNNLGDLCAFNMPMGCPKFPQARLWVADSLNDLYAHLHDREHTRSSPRLLR